MTFCVSCTQVPAAARRRALFSCGQICCDVRCRRREYVAHRLHRLCPTKLHRGEKLRLLATHSFWLAKAGNTPDEYEDAFCIGKWTGGRVPLAIADGATESLLSRNWANLLVKRFVRQPFQARTLDVWLSNTLRAWQHEKRAYIRKRELNNKPVQWYEEPGLEAGAFAAFLGIVLSRAKNAWHWNAVAIGDCCLFQVRANALLCAFPFKEANAFSNRPFLLSSNPARNRDIAQRCEFAHGKAQRGDRFYFMTDALAAWFLRSHEQGDAPWLLLDSFCGDARRDPSGFRKPERSGTGAPIFSEWIQEQRAAHAMRNDDVTLIRLAI